MKQNICAAAPSELDAEVAVAPRDGFLGVKELTVQEFLLSALRLAKLGLRRHSIDEFEQLLEFCFTLGRNHWPPEVARFLDRRILPPSMRRPKVRRRVEWFKRPAHRMRSKQDDLDRFYGDPNHLAAHLAMIFIAEMRGGNHRSKRKGPYKVQLADGSKVPVSSAAVRRAIDQVDSTFLYAGSTKRANEKVVKELVRKGRTRRPE